MASSRLRLNTSSPSRLSPTSIGTMILCPCSRGIKVISPSELGQNAILKWQVLRRVIDVRRDRSRSSSPGKTFVVERKGSNAEGEPFDSKLLDV